MMSKSRASFLTLLSEESSGKFRSRRGKRQKRAPTIPVVRNVIRLALIQVRKGTFKNFRNAPAGPVWSASNPDFVKEGIVTMAEYVHF
jgi:hypothetical protein